MRILAVDNDAEELKKLTGLLGTIYPGSEILPFTDPLMAVKASVGERVNLLLAAAEMKPLSGFMLGKMMRKKNPEMETVIIADDDAYRRDARKLMMLYIVRPLSADALRRDMEGE